MSASSSSIYWSVGRLVQQISGGTDSQANVSARHRRLRSQAYAILLDMEEESYPDVPEDRRELTNAQTAAQEFLSLRSEGRHGTAGRISWRLDELAELEQQQQQHQLQADNILPRVISLLFHLRGLGSSDDGLSAAISIPRTSFTFANAAAAAAAAAGPDTASVVLQTTVSLPAYGILEPLGGGAADTAATAAAATSTAIYDGIPVGRRLRLLPPRKASLSPDALAQTVSVPPPLHPPHHLPLHQTPAPVNILATSGSFGGGSGPNLTVRVGPLQPGGGAATAAAIASDLTSWFPFRDCAGLPLPPAFDTPLEDLLLRQNEPHIWTQNFGKLPLSLRMVAAGTASNVSGGGAATDIANRRGTAFGEMPSVPPLFLGPLHQSLVHTRFHHLNPLLLRLNGTQSECFRLSVEEANAAAVAAAAAVADASAGEGEGEGVHRAAEGAVAGLQVGDGQGSVDLPAPFALAALGVGFSSELQTFGSIMLPLPPQLGQSGLGSANLSMHLPVLPSVAYDAYLSPPVGSATARCFRSQLGAFGAGTTMVVQRSSRHSKTRVAHSMPGGGSVISGSVEAAAATAVSRSAAEDEVLLYDMAVMALQGVASALWILRSGMIRSHCIRLASQRRLLAQLCDTGELRLRLGAFVASYGTYGTTSPSGDSRHDEALAAFSDAVRKLLALYDKELQELAAWHRKGLTTRPRGSAAGTSAYGKGSGGGRGGSYNGAFPFSALFNDKKAQVKSPPKPSGESAGPDGGGMLGLLLCLAPLRVHLQRLADVCMCVPDPAWIPPPSHGSTAAVRTKGSMYRDDMSMGGGGPLLAAARMTVPPLAPSLWQVYGFPQGAELLDRLYGALLQTDHAKTPLLRLLFAAACMPYVRRMRAWMYDPLEGSTVGGAAGVVVGGAGSVAAPPTPPAFTAPLQRLLTAAGLQMRLLEELSGDLGDIAERFRRIAAAEAEEARLISQQYDEALTPTSLTGPTTGGATATATAATGGSSGGGGQDITLLPGVPGISLFNDDGGAAGGGAGKGKGTECGGQGSTADEFNYPLVFGLEALQQLSEAAAAAAAARDSELSSLLVMLDRRRQAVAEAANQQVLAAAQASLAAAEVARAAKVAATQARRLARSRLLAEQRAEMDERAARLRAERERRIAEEQSLAAEVVLREHNEAAAALAAELARLRASYGGASYSEGGIAGGAAAVAAGMLLVDERAAEAAVRLRRCEWREARMALAARRRLLWLGIQAEELAELRQVVRRARSAQAAAPGVDGKPEVDVATDAAADAAVDTAVDTELQSKEGDGSGGRGSGFSSAGVQKLTTVMVEAGGGGANEDVYDKVAGKTASLPPQPGPIAIPRSPRDGAPLSLTSLQSSPAETPRPISSPWSSCRGSPVIVASVSRPRRATFHDSGPSIVGSAAATALLSPTWRARASDGGGAVPRTPHRDIVGPRPMGLHNGSVRRSNSLTGHTAFAAAMSPSTSVPASWGAEPDAANIAGENDPWVRAAGVSHGTSTRPPSPGGGARQGPPRGYMPSAWGASGRGPAGRGGAAGGLLLELQSRQSRRRWVLPDAAAAAAGGAMPVTTTFLAQPLQSLGRQGVNYEDMDPPSLRRQQSLGTSGSGGGGVAPEAATDAVTATARGQQPGVMAPADAAAVAVWAAAWPVAGAVPGATLNAAGDAGLVSNGLSCNLLQDGGGGNGRAHLRRRALWKVPTVTASGVDAVYERTSTVVGVFRSAISTTHTATTHQAHPFQPLLISPKPRHTPAVDGWNDPVKALLQDYMKDPQVAKRVHAAYSPSRRDTADIQYHQAPLISIVNTQRRDVLDVADPHQRPVAFGGGIHMSVPQRPRRAPLSEDLAYAPVGVAVQTCLYGTVLAQYRLTTRAIWHVLVHEYRLLQYCEALRRFFFCEAGDVAGALADSLTRRVEAKPHVPPSTPELRAMLDEALHSCSMLYSSGGSAAGGAAAAAGARLKKYVSGAIAEGGGYVDSSTADAEKVTIGGGVVGGDEGARVVQMLRVQSVPRRNVGTGSYFASDVLYVTSQVPRPLDNVITPDSMRDYADVFSLLLRVCCAASVLAGCWSRLNAATGPLVVCELSGDWRQHQDRRRQRGGGAALAAAATGLHPIWQKRLAIARLWLQAASQVVGLLRQHLQVELQTCCWAGLASALAGPSPQDLIQMREAHERYLACAREVCMLPPRDVCRPDTLTTSPTRKAAATGSGSGVAQATSGNNKALQQQQQQLRYQQVLPGAPLMDALQGATALAAVLRRALLALETQAAVLSAPPRQLTVSPVLSVISRACQTRTGPDGGPVGPRASSLEECAEMSVREMSVDVAANDLDELWAHVVMCQGQLGRTLGALYGALRCVAGSASVGGGGGVVAGGGTSGLLGEMMVVLSSEPCRSYLEVGGWSRG